MCTRSSGKNTIKRENQAEDDVSAEQVPIHPPSELIKFCNGSEMTASTSLISATNDKVCDLSQNSSTYQFHFVLNLRIGMTLVIHSSMHL